MGKKIKERSKKYRGTLRLYISWPLILTLFLAAGTVGIFFIDKKAGFATLALTMAYAVIAAVIRMYNRKAITNDMVNFATSFGQVQKELLKIEDHDAYLEKLHAGLDKEKKELLSVCGRLSRVRSRAALRLQEQMKEALRDLNFENIEFEIRVEPDPGSLSSAGYDSVSFMISLNKGEKLMPLENVASGGELSRIMLALKTVLADTDDIPTLIFDEIDTGISGRTAEKVAEKLAILSKSRQVIAITHLPQIAAMADHHFVIEKNSDDSSTETSVRELKGDEPAEELCRLLSGSAVTDAVRENAKEMLALAAKFKKESL